MPAGSQPEALSNVQPDWDSANQQFLVRIDCRFGIATAATNADFLLAGRIDVADGNGGALTSLSIDNHRVESDGGAGGGDVALVPPRLAWDRQSGAFTGRTRVTGFVELRNPSGQLLDRHDITGRDVDVG